LYLGHCYAPLKRYAEALMLVQHANIALRETMGTLSDIDSDPISTTSTPFYPLSRADILELESSITSNGLRFKREWFAYNGGSVNADGKTYRKPLFFNIALNYVELNMDQLMERAGKGPVGAPAVPSQAVQEKKPVSKAKVEEVRPATLEPPVRKSGGLSSLLGGWWGKS
jgi:signal recognition particle subunit SRP68